MSDSLRGHFLIAGRGLRDPNFYKSVVLMVEHNDDGAMGVIVNRPSGITVAHALKSHVELPETGEMVYVGGPVERNALFILHNATDLDTSDTPVIDGLFVGSNPEVFESIIRRAADGDDDLKFRVYFGCSGWAPDQLESEIARNDWLMLPAELAHVFAPDPYSVWDETLAEYRKTHPLAPGAGGDPSLN